jgi:multidrug efflux pump subunit AcrA (membrane-fusion protein)
LIRSNSLTVVQSEAPGRILALKNRIGDCVKRGQLMARIDTVKQEVGQQEAELQLEQLIRQDRTGRSAWKDSHSSAASRD